MPGIQLFAAFLSAGFIALAAWRAGFLSKSGAYAAAICGGILFGFGGWEWAALLLAFFVSSSLLSRAFDRRKAELSEKFAKGSRRDWGQVYANGGLGAALALASWLLPGTAWPWAAFVGAMAAVNADTWATELGVLNRKPPRLITTGKIVERGTSGGVSALGSLSAVAGAGWIGICAAGLSLFQSGADVLVLLLAALAGGVTGAFFDSLLGATIQSIYYCPQCRKETERSPIHTCGAATLPLRGLRWLDNDLVNFFASLAGALLSLAIWLVLQ